MKPALRFQLFIAACLLASGCNQPSPGQPPEDANTLHGAEATFPAPLYEKWITEYERPFPDRRVKYDVVGSDEGVKRFLAGTVDFGASDALNRVSSP